MALYIQVDMLQDSNVTHLPNLNGQDVCRAYELYSKSSKYMRGKDDTQTSKAGNSGKRKG
jgi:hypothetical protein